MKWAPCPLIARVVLIFLGYSSQKIGFLPWWSLLESLPLLAWMAILRMDMRIYLDITSTMVAADRRQLFGPSDWYQLSFFVKEVCSLSVWPLTITLNCQLSHCFDGSRSTSLPRGFGGKRTLLMHEYEAVLSAVDVSRSTPRISISNADWLWSSLWIVHFLSLALPAHVTSGDC